MTIVLLLLAVKVILGSQPTNNTIRTLGKGHLGVVHSNNLTKSRTSFGEKELSFPLE